MTETVRIEDPTAHRMAGLLKELEQSALRQVVGSELQALLRANHPLPPCTSGNRWTGASLSSFYESLHATLEQELRRRAAKLSKVAWLWYSRRIPTWMFRGKLTSTGFYIHTLFDSVTGQGGSDERSLPLREGRVEYDLDMPIARQIASMVYGVELLYNIQVWFRIAAKNIEFVAPAVAGYRGYLPVPSKFDPNWTFARLYDARHEDSSGPFRLFTATGTIVGTSPTEPDAMMIVGPIAERWVSFPVIEGEQTHLPAQQKEVYAKFGLELVNIDALADLDRKLGGSGHQWIDEEIALCLFMSRLMLLALDSISFALVDAARYGYLVLPNHVFRQFFDAAVLDVSGAVSRITPGLGITNFEQFLDGLAGFVGELWPPVPGPVVRRADEGVYIDLVAASLRLRSLLQYPPEQGEVANIRADHFEHAVQRVVDGSPWSPSLDLRNFRGRTLRRKKARLTDIDAVGELKGHLLLISCKSVPYSRDYDRGVYSTVRNVASMAKKAVEDWQRLRTAIAISPVGDNFDFSPYTGVICVVVTPFAVYSADPATLAEAAPGLLRVSSVTELMNWLEQPFEGHAG